MQIQHDQSDDSSMDKPPVIKKPGVKKTLGDLKSMSIRGKSVLSVARDQMLAPDSVKTAPLFTIPTISAVTGVHRSTITKAIQKRAVSNDGDTLPRGRIETTKGTYVPFDSLQPDENLLGNERRYFSCDEAAKIIAHFAPHLVKPTNAKGAVVVVCNYKGGVAKTVSSVSLAQALASRGKKVLCFDLDPQGSMTNLFGFLHVKDVRPEDTALGLFLGQRSSLRTCVRNTYWPNIDLIPASSDLQGSEYAFRQLLQREGLDSVGIVGTALDELMGGYDVCIIDTPPSLNSLTNSALFAADGVIMPIPASNLEVASAVQFWDMFCMICDKMPGVTNESEVFSFLKVILPKMENTVSCRNVKAWIYDIYGDDVSIHEIPKSTSVARASDSFGTVFDVHQGSKKLVEAVQPVKTAYENIALEIEAELQAIWQKKTTPQAK